MRLLRSFCGFGEASSFQSRIALTIPWSVWMREVNMLRTSAEISVGSSSSNAATRARMLRREVQARPELTDPRQALKVLLG
jgi:hypothetical protein